MQAGESPQFNLKKRAIFLPTPPELDTLAGRRRGNMKTIAAEYQSSLLHFGFQIHNMLLSQLFYFATFAAAILPQGNQLFNFG